MVSVNGFHEALFEIFKNKFPASNKFNLDSSNDADNVLMKAKIMNNLAMRFLTFAMDSPQLLSKIKAPKSKDWPGGLVYALVAKLMKKYKPDDTLTVAEHTKKLMSLRQKRKEDPETLGDVFVVLETRLHNPRESTLIQSSRQRTSSRRMER